MEKRILYEVLLHDPELKTQINADLQRISSYHKKAVKDRLPSSVIKTGLDAHFIDLLNKYNLDFVDLEILRLLYNNVIKNYNWVIIK